jgi:hypothetical protein
MIHRKGIRRVALFLVLGGAAAAILGFVVMNLWNWLVPEIFGGRIVTFWQAMGILVLSRIFFGGFFGRHGRGGPGRLRIIDKWERMTPEDREKFRQGMRRGCSQT